MRVSTLLGLAAVVVALLLAVPVLLATPIPDVNPPVVGDPEPAVYADLRISLTLREICRVTDPVNGVQTCAVTAQDVALSSTEVLQLPTAPAATFVWPKATITGVCTTYITIDVTGPGLNGVISAQSINKNIAKGETDSYPFGHLYFLETGTHSVSMELFAWKCYGLETPTSIFTLTRQFDFDGVND